MKKRVAYAVMEVNAPGSREHSIGMRGLSPHRTRDARGYAMAGLLVMLGVMGILSSMLMPVWNQSAKREREAELIFRGEQYARAVELYQRRYVGANPPDFETLVDQRFLRQLYADPMADDGEFQVIYFSQMAEVQGEPATADRPGESTSDATDGARVAEPIQFGDGQEGGVVGVVSRSEEESLRVYNGRETYNEWAFVYATSTTDAGGLAVDGGVQPARRGPGDAGPGRGPDRSGRPGGVGNRGAVDGPPQPHGRQPR